MFKIEIVLFLRNHHHSEFIEQGYDLFFADSFNKSKNLFFTLKNYLKALNLKEYKENTFLIEEGQNTNNVKHLIENILELPKIKENYITWIHIYPPTEMFLSDCDLICNELSNDKRYKEYIVQDIIE
jgi:hypothetical protein